MIKTVAYHKVENFATWKTAFDKFLDFRKSSGEKSAFVGTSRKDPNMVWVINEWESAAAAEKFFASSQLAGAMKDGGLLGTPEVAILDSRG